jgi:hypothetical protein
MVEIIVGSALATGLFMYFRRRDRQRPAVLGSLGERTPVAVPPRPRRRRTPLQRIVVLLGPLTMLAGLLVIVWPQAPSDCHGSPVCALDAFEGIGKLFIGGLLGMLGLAWFLIAAAATSGHGRTVNDSTRPVE